MSTIEAQIEALVEQKVREALAEREQAADGYLDSKAAARYLHYSGDNPRKWASEFAARRECPVYRDGTRLLFKREDLDRALQRQEP